MIWVVVALVAINLISFGMFAARRSLDKKIWLVGIFGVSDELAAIIAIGGSFGAFVAMRFFKKGIEDDSVFKIAIPVSMVIQVLAIGYLLLFNLGIVK